MNDEIRAENLRKVNGALGALTGCAFSEHDLKKLSGDAVKALMKLRKLLGGDASQVRIRKIKVH